MRNLFFLFSLLIAGGALARLPDLIPYRKGNVWGYCDSTKKILIEPQWGSVNFFVHSRAVVRQNGKSGVIDTNGTYVLQPQYSYCSICSPNRFLVKAEDEKWGMIDDSGNVIIPFTAYFIIQESDSVINVVMRDNRSRVCDLNGNTIFTGDYLGWDYGFGEAGKYGLFIVIDRKEWKSNFFRLIRECPMMYVMDKNEQPLFPGRFDWIELVADSLFECRTGDSLCYYNFSGKRVQLSDAEMRLIGKQKGYWNSPPMRAESVYIKDEEGNPDNVFLGYTSETGIQYWED